MKRLLAVIVTLFMSVSVLSAQDESVKPTLGVSFDRPVANAIIEGQFYQNVIVEVTAADYNDGWKGVVVVVRDSASRKKILKKRLPKSYLYAFSEGTISIGKGNALTQMLLFKHEEYGKKEWWMEFREKGLY
ncbi:MAG: hypothetical protein IK010_05300 [Bacteroidales bacterium]|nr:hypothetical protein [Bacteroidales bacterium]